MLGESVLGSSCVGDACGVLTNSLRRRRGLQPAFTSDSFSLYEGLISEIFTFQVWHQGE
jgi:hypothetical protein